MGSTEDHSEVYAAITAFPKAPAISDKSKGEGRVCQGLSDNTEAKRPSSLWWLCQEVVNKEEGDAQVLYLTLLL